MRKNRHVRYFRKKRHLVNFGKNVAISYKRFFRQWNSSKWLSSFYEEIFHWSFKRFWVIHRGNFFVIIRGILDWKGTKSLFIIFMYTVYRMYVKIMLIKCDEKKLLNNLKTENNVFLWPHLMLLWFASQTQIMFLQ